MGLDYERVMYQYNGPARRLTNVHDRVVDAVVA